MKTQMKVVPISTARKKTNKTASSLEYGLMASLAFQKYAHDDRANFTELLSIPLTDRIPALIHEFGLKKIHPLLRLVLEEFCLSVDLPRSKKLSETGISICACDLVLVAEEDQLSMEDLIVFFELTKRGRYGKFPKLLTHFGIMEKLEQFRQERYQAYVQLKELKEAEQRQEGPAERISPTPTPIKQLFEHKGARIIPFNNDLLQVGPKKF